MKIYYFISIIISSVLILSCAEDPEPSLYDPNWTSGTQPEIHNLSPDSVFAGIGIVTIDGANFSGNPNQNFVYFNKTQGTVLAANENQLQVKTPNLIGDSIRIKIAVHGAELFSEPVYYKLYPAVEPVHEFNKEKTDVIEQADQIACDKEGNIYYTLKRENVVNEMADEGLYYLPKDSLPERIGDVLIYQSIKLGPNDQIYALYGRRKRIYTYPSGGGDNEVWSPRGLGGDLTDFEFDANLNVWVTSSSENEIYRITQDKDLKAFPFEGNAQAVRVYNNALYIGAERDSVVKIYKLDIVSADSLGPESEYLDLTSLGKSVQLTGITFSADGHMYFSANTEAAIYISPPGGLTFSSLYPELFDEEKRTLSMVWGPQNEFNLFITRQAVYPVDEEGVVGDLIKTATILRVDTQKEGAPNYGRGDM